MRSFEYTQGFCYYSLTWSGMTNTGSLCYVANVSTLKLDEVITESILMTSSTFTVHFSIYHYPVIANHGYDSCCSESYMEPL